MKRIGLLFLSIMLLIGNVAAQNVMVVTKKDGTKTTFNINSVQDISFINSEDINISISEIVPTSTTSFLVKYSIATVGKINESGVCYGSEVTADAFKTVGTAENGEGSVEINGREFNKIIYLRAYANIDGKLYYSDIITHTTSEMYPVAKMVDLGLSVKWASHDLGAINEENAGLHLPWGDVTGSAQNSATYPNINITKECISGTEYDIVTKEWGDKWRMPTQKEFEELWNNTERTFITSHGYDGIKAVKFTAKNGNSIILTLSGQTVDKEADSYNKFGFYWTGDFPIEDAGNIRRPVSIGIQSEYIYQFIKSKAYNNKSIRPVYGDLSSDDAGNVEHEYVDLGLSRLWATVNYGANSPTDVGTYLAWGEQKSKDLYTQDNYEFYVDGEYTEIGILGDKNLDIVANEWGGKWHMPTYDEIQELINDCIWTWTTEQNAQGKDIKGYKITSKTNGNSIFLPATGCKQLSSTNDTESGVYWTGEQHKSSNKPHWAYYLEINEKEIFLGGKSRFNGCVIRPVRKR